MTIRIRPAIIADAPRLSRLAATTFRDTFERENTPDDIARYVAHAWHGRGVAQALMDALVDAARAHGARTLWLGVWERNPRAAAFYRKHGFQRVGEHTFLLGDDAQTDWLLARPLTAGP